MRRLPATFVWALAVGAFVWLAGIAVGVPRWSAGVAGGVVALAVFLFLRLYGETSSRRL